MILESSETSLVSLGILTVVIVNVEVVGLSVSVVVAGGFMYQRTLVFPRFF